ncbi:hypothetical protein [Sandaracinus amylolyticus]|uniref:Co-chaperone DjlA N-terminal domain-containing protein n=1 Tax=Sandaracinus amylolyticus TaxID=927083 RepID=A0A0F6SDR6_9BACT|nr:hypothetical protein [Sandaracinus amylolyticus]AKF03909.1 hypothetical protein DB32_001058 [Sandaracinus amylolyticus]
MKVRDRILVITDLMLGALYADATMTGEEDRAVRELLAKLLLCPPDALPEHVDARIRGFSLMEFDIELAARDFLKDPPMKKRRLLELIASLTDKDGTDLREDEYLRDLGQCLGMQPDEYADIVLSYEIESLRESFDMIRLGDEITGPIKLGRNPEDDLPRWRRKALRQRRESERHMQVQKAAAEEQSPPKEQIAPAVTERRDPTGPRHKTVPPPIPEGARKKG